MIDTGPSVELGDRPRLRRLVEDDDRRRRSRPTSRRASAARVASSASAFGTRLAVDADVGPRDRLEPLERDLAPGVRADAVGALLHARRAPRRSPRRPGGPCAESSRSRSRSTLTVSPSPDSSSNCVSPASRSRASCSASAASSSAWCSEPLLLVEQLLAQALERLRATASAALGRHLEARELADHGSSCDPRPPSPATSPLRPRRQACRRHLGDHRRLRRLRRGRRLGRGLTPS